MRLVSTDINEEQVLVRQLKSGDIYAFEELYTRYKRQISFNIVKLVKSVPIAEDLVHDLFIRVWMQRERLDPDKTFGGYLFRMAENITMDFFRKIAQDNKFRAYYISHSDIGYSHVEETLADKDNKALLQEAVALLPPQCRLIFTLCKLEGKSSEEVSVQLKLSTHTVSNHLAKAKKIMRDFLLVNAHDAATLSLLLFIVNFSD
ncbi:RNA polymerase ECF-type sigma factor [Arcticibacter svalbardensis MN12-7]|uniref:RNA polymerase ECF-type sigma factor n=1 Tax=Arcticibacter svalbardensis MN12-7 TaxID=1150600 RepID=R9GRJ0_9SPHI|nr:sigma-70 family RNA polymerase sigma factor [Arcticibacter svalbardensis]EOR94313.1 RNA polymerase ECF-type sigma factor [Arcticibacter svalbardensis MN12-7]